MTPNQLVSECRAAINKHIAEGDKLVTGGFGVSVKNGRVVLAERCGCALGMLLTEKEPIIKPTRSYDWITNIICKEDMLDLTMQEMEDFYDSFDGGGRTTPYAMAGREIREWSLEMKYLSLS